MSMDSATNGAHEPVERQRVGTDPACDWAGRTAGSSRYCAV
jgi:hypothetical protein